MDNPKVSIVVTSRNDNHGFALARRTQIFLNTLFELASDYSFPLELVIVEWNPPKDRPSLAEAFDYSKAAPYTRVKIVTVPNEVHNRFTYHASLPLYQMIAKNVGIRRAQGEFVLATNIDVIFSRELFELIVKEPFEQKKLYRAQRFDVDEAVPLEASLNERLEYCKQHIIRLNYTRRSTQLESGISSSRSTDRFPMGMDFHAREDLPQLATMACGDFQLMHRNDWHEVHGYAELDMQSFHIDSILEYQAHLHGIEEVIYGDPFRFYHIEHEHGFRIDHQRFEQDILKRGIKKLTYDEFKDIIRSMMHGNPDPDINVPHWGLWNDPLPECILKP